MAHDEEATRLGLLKLDTEERIDFRFVAEAAGDRELSPSRHRLHEELRHQRGRHLYSDLLFVLTHLHYAPDRAEALWTSVLAHREELNRALGRNVGVVVAAVDYLSNVEREVHQPTLIPLPKMSAVAEIATRDGMTGLYDHSSFHVTLRREWARHQRHGNPLSLILMDVDRFKRYNDARGHPAGDRVLSDIARIVHEGLREVDMAARYGGEEFAVLAPSTPVAEAQALAERLRGRIRHELAREKVTVSLGVATAPGHARSPAGLIKAADRALYDSKARGRNRTTVSTSRAR